MEKKGCCSLLKCFGNGSTESLFVDGRREGRRGGSVGACVWRLRTGAGGVPVYLSHKGCDKVRLKSVQITNWWIMVCFQISNIFDNKVPLFYKTLHLDIIVSRM